MPKLTTSSWYRAAIRQKGGPHSCRRHDEDVVYESVDGRINDRIDDAYRAKYAGSPYLMPMIGPPRVQQRCACCREDGR